MFEFDIGRFVAANHALGVLGQMLNTQQQMLFQKGQFQPNEPLGVWFPERDWLGWRDHAEALVEISGAADLPIIKRQAQRLLDEMARFSPSNDRYEVPFPGPLLRLRGVLGELTSATRMETETKLFLSLGNLEAELWSEAGPPFGQRVEDAFGIATTDELKEAAKCLALGRATAAVFHLMRTMEAAVRVLGTKLSATVTDSKGETLPWGMILANIKAKIDALPKGHDQDEWLKVHALLHSVNRAYRTKTAHPAASYNEEQARSAWGATKAFLQEMAERAL